MPHESLGAEDTALLCATDPSAQLQIGALCFFQATPLRDADGRVRLGDLRRHVESRLHLSPRFRQRMAPIVFDAARPMWLDDDRFDITRHVDVVELAAPADMATLRELVADLLSTPLDPRRPLWDLRVVDGFDDELVAVVLRVHHVMADGLSLLDAALLLLDTEPNPRPVRSKGWKAEPEPGADRMFLQAVAARLRSQASVASTAARTMLDPRRVIGGLRAVLGLAGGVVGARAPVGPEWMVKGRVGGRRDFVWAALPIADLRGVARDRGVTLNDVVLAIVAGALRRSVGAEDPGRLERRSPCVLVPIGSASEAAGVTGNKFRFVVAELPVAVEEPLTRLDRVHAEMDRLKRSTESSVSSALFSLVDIVPLPILRRLGPIALARQPFVDLAVTNIPGSQEPMYLLGARMEELHPIVTGVGNLALIVGVLSYCDVLGLGVTVDPDIVEDPDGFLDDLVEATSELIQASRSVLARREEAVEVRPQLR